MKYRKWLTEWLEYYVKVSVKERTYMRYCQQAKKYLIPMLGGYDLEMLTATELQKFSAALKAKGLAGSSINFLLFLLKSSLKKAVSLGLVEREYTDALMRPKTRRKAVSCFSAEEQHKIERYILERQSPKLFGIVLCLYTGLRIGELLALTWDDLDLRQGTITVRKSCHDSWVGNRYIKVFDTPKTQCSERVIPVPRQLILHLRTMKKSSACPYVVTGKSEYGAQIRSYQRTFELLLKKLSIEHKGFHALRHTFATRALEVGMDVKTLSEILGHQNPVVTLQRYAHSMIEHKTEMMNKVGRLLA